MMEKILTLSQTKPGAKSIPIKFHQARLARKFSLKNIRRTIQLSMNKVKEE